MASAKEMSGSQLAKFYANKNILITGASGFLGQIIVQKLLRSCPDVRGIYLIIRQKKGMDPEERMDQMLQNPLFDILEKDVPDYRKKLHPISGDLKYDGIGLSTTDRQLLKDQINIVLHSAATVNFNERLKTAVNINIKGTRELLDLCEEMKNLLCIMVTSTAYSFCPRWNIGEYFMEPPVKPDTIIKMVNDMDEATLNDITPRLIGEWPNTYTYTKAIMEDLVNSRRDRLPVGMYRPSIVLPTYKDPLECWTGNLNGPVGIALGVGAGITHVIYGYSKVRTQMIPGDYCVNGFLAATHDVYKKYQEEKTPEKIIYNYVTAPQNSFTYKGYHDFGLKYLAPFSVSVWAMYSFFTNCPVMYWILDLMIHSIPSFFMDVYLKIQGQKPRIFKISQNIYTGNKRLHFFLVHEWNMHYDNVKELWGNMNTIDKTIFPFDMETLNWDDYFKNFSWGLKRYVFKDKMDKESIEKDLAKQKKLQLYHQIFVYSLYVFSALSIWFMLSYVLKSL